MLWIQYLQPEIIYIALSSMVAIIIWFEGQMLKNTDGKMPESSWFHFGSLVDTLWFFVSVAVLFFLEFQSVAFAVPVAYGLYSMFGWFYGVRLMAKDGMPASPEDLVIPMKYVAYSQSFALIFFLLCLAVIGISTLEIKLPVYL